VVISRCAWHPRYYGYSKLLGVSVWRGLRVDFTDGICPKCAARVRVARQRAVVAGRPATRGSGRTSEVAAVALAVLTGLVLVARPANEGSTPTEVGIRPRAVTLVQARPGPAPGLEGRVLRPPVLRPTLVERREGPVHERLQSP
jgi:hypothetical protein